MVHHSASKATRHRDRTIGNFMPSIPLYNIK